MNGGPNTAAQLPGVDPAWSRFVAVPDALGATRTWHVLDHGEPVVGTMLCVHGNPTWSYLWRRFLAAAPPGWRVVAVDQLGMGWSERTGPRTLGMRVADLSALTQALGITGPVVSVAHDWGGPISLGWAQEHTDQLAGLVLTNTGVNLPAGSAPPPLIRLARTPALRDALCVRTPAFLRATSALSRPALPAAIRRALEQPYAGPDRRSAIGDFVADIPVESAHPSRATLDAIVGRMPELADVPALLVWGPRDPVFTERQLDDLAVRLPGADIQRYAGASHLVTEDAPQAAADVWSWVAAHVPRPAAEVLRTDPQPAPLPWAALVARAQDPDVAVAEVRGGVVERTSFAVLEEQVQRLAAGLAAHGVRAGERVALLVPPGRELTVAVYACWRLGAVIVVADAGLGVGGLAHALRSAAPDHVIGIPRALLAVGALRVPGRRIWAGAVPVTLGRALGWAVGLDQLSRTPLAPVPDPGPDDREAAVLFTSGATGPAKGVVYRLSQLSAQIAQVKALCGMGPDDRLVAAFAPFALYGPALGVGAVVPDMTVTAPGTLTAAALADAVAAIDATVVFASPAALRNVVATAGAATPEQRQALGGIRLVMSAGAPVPLGLLRALQRELPAAELHTPYGMTEVLPVTDIALAGIEAAGSGPGVCVGRPLAGVEVAVSPLDADGQADGVLTRTTGVTGEVCIAAAHVKDHYDRLWATERRSSRNPGWHRSGDVGHLDADGRLWIEGRLVHVITTADGPVTPVGLEQRLETQDGVEAVAVVGVGPAGTQVVVAVVVPRDGSRSVLAPPELAAAARAAVGVPLAAVLQIARLPVDIRHASKIDRLEVGRWAARVLAGGRP